jgi:hypothetical protein
MTGEGIGNALLWLSWVGIAACVYVGWRMGE